MSIRTAWNALLDEIEALGKAKTAELNHGVTLIEAAAADKTRVELAAVVGYINVDLYLQGAVEMAKLGIWPDDLEEMGRLWSRAKMLGLDSNDTYLRILRNEVKA